MTTQYIIPVTENKWGVVKTAVGCLAPSDLSACMFLTDSDYVHQQALVLGVACLRLIAPLPGSGIENQSESCAAYLLENQTLSPGEEVYFLTPDVLRSVGLSKKPKQPLSQLSGQKTLFLEEIPINQHPMAARAGYTIVDVFYAARVEHQETEDAQVRTTPFFFNWMSYGIHATAGSAGKTWAGDIKGASFIVEEQLNIKTPPCISPIELDYEITGETSAIRLIHPSEIDDVDFDLDFVPVHRKAMQCPVLFIKTRDNRTGTFLGEQLVDKDISLVFYPANEERMDVGPLVINHKKSDAFHLNRSKYHGNSLAGPLPLCDIPFDSFLCVVLGHATHGDVDFFHHIPICPHLYTYDSSTDTLYTKDGAKFHGRQSYPALFRSLMAVGTLSSMADPEIPFEREVLSAVINDAGYDTTTRSFQSGLPGFCSEFKVLNNILWELETSDDLPPMHVVEKFTAKLDRAMRALSPHLLLRRMKYCHTEHLAPEVSELPLIKVLNVHDNIILRAWKTGTEMQGRRLPALRRDISAGARSAMRNDEFPNYVFGREIIKRAFDIAPSAIDGNIWVSDVDGKRVLSFARDHTCIASLKDGFESPRFFFSNGDDLHICDPFALKVFYLPPTGKHIPFSGPGALHHDRWTFFPASIRRLGEGYLCFGMTKDFMIGYFLCDDGGNIIRVLIPPQHAAIGQGIFTLGHNRMIVANYNESALHVYDFSTRTWENVDLNQKRLTVNGLCMHRDILYVRSPPNVFRFNPVTREFERFLYNPELFGTSRWPFTAFQCFRQKGVLTLFTGLMDGGVAGIEIE
jgi:hypothetical protein